MGIFYPGFGKNYILASLAQNLVNKRQEMQQEVCLLMYLIWPNLDLILTSWADALIKRYTTQSYKYES